MTFIIKIYQGKLTHINNRVGDHVTFVYGKILSQLMAAPMF